MAPQVVAHPEARPIRSWLMDEARVHPETRAGDPFTSFAPPQDHPHACTDGLVFLTYAGFDEEFGDEVERVEALPCRRCIEEASR